MSLSREIERLRTADADRKRDFRILLAHVLGRRSPPPLDAAFRLSAEQEDRLLGLWRRREAHEPVQYLLGEWDFFGRTFRTDPRALIPRPETEHLVEEALREAPDPGRAIDLGCGAGILAVTLALERPRARVVAVDASIAALALARENVRRHGVAGRVALAGSDWGRAVRSAAFALALSNPPYVSASDAAALPENVRAWEPHAALFAGGDGLSEIRRLLDDVPRLLLPGAPFLFEIGFGQREAVAAEVARRPAWALSRFVPDLAGIPRVCVARRTGGDGGAGKMAVRP